VSHLHGHWRHWQPKDEKDLSFHLGNNITFCQEIAKDLSICTDSSVELYSDITQNVAKAYAR